LTKLEQNALREKRKEIQMIFQDPLASLNPRMTIGDIIAEPLITFYPTLPREEVKEKVRAMMTKVGLLPNLVNRYPHEFSGGQCQRIGIARALILEPKMIICDEPVSALDVSIQAQVVNLLKSLQKEMGLSLIFIAHDLSVVKHISDRVLVMYLGNAVELGPARRSSPIPCTLYQGADVGGSHPGSGSGAQQGHPDPGRGPAIPMNPPSGCVFRTRCPVAGRSAPRPGPSSRATSTTRFPASRWIRSENLLTILLRGRDQGYALLGTHVFIYIPVPALFYLVDDLSRQLVNRFWRTVSRGRVLAHCMGDKMPLGAIFPDCYYPPHKGSNFSPVCRHYGAPISCSAPGSRAVDVNRL
jgi:ABC-type oligopeptide transport system ATPase subunit